MENATTKISSKNQIVIPKDIRQDLKVKAGDEIMLVSRNGIVYLLPKPESLAKALRGLAKKMGVPYGRSYLKKEKASW